MCSTVAAVHLNRHGDWSIAATEYLDCGNGDCGDAFALPDWTELFVRRRFNAHVGFAHTDCCRNVLSHRRTVRGEFWRFGDDSRIDIDHASIFLFEQIADPPQNLHA